MEYEEAHRKGAFDQITKSHNSVMTFLELERLELSQLNAALQLFLERWTSSYSSLNENVIS